VRGSRCGAALVGALVGALCGALVGALVGAALALPTGVGASGSVSVPGAPPWWAPPWPFLLV
jgi:hypothetical protein